MPEETDGGAEQQPINTDSQGGQPDDGEQTPVDQPKIDVQAPLNIIQTEAEDYSKITTRDAGKRENKDE